MPQAAPAETTAQATARVADAAETVAQTATGISNKLWSNIAQMGAVGVVCVAFLYMQQNTMSQLRELQTAGMAQSREERQLHRETIASMQKEASERYTRTETAHKETMGRMGTTIERAVTSLEKATEVMAESNRRKDGGP